MKLAVVQLFVTFVAIVTADPIAQGTDADASGQQVSLYVKRDIPSSLLI
jgi:hypothetical protein